MRHSKRKFKFRDDGAFGTGARSKSKNLDRAFRLKTFLREGSILDLYHQKILDCLFLNVSMHGACLRLPADVPLPPKLIIFDEWLAISVHADVRWQRGNEVGLYIRNGVPSWMPPLWDDGGRTRIAWGRL